MMPSQKGGMEIPTIDTPMEVREKSDSRRTAA